MPCRPDRIRRGKTRSLGANLVEAGNKTFEHYSQNFKGYFANTNLVCTYFNAKLILVNVMKFDNVNFFERCDILDLSSAHACHVISVKQYNVLKLYLKVSLNFIGT